MLWTKTSMLAFIKIHMYSTLNCLVLSYLILCPRTGSLTSFSALELIRKQFQVIVTTLSKKLSNTKKYALRNES